MAVQHINGHSKSSTQEQILYEIVVHKDWKLDPEQWKPITQHTLVGHDNPHSWWWNLLGFQKIFKKIPWPEEDLAKAAVCLLPWQITLSPDGKRVAVLQETVLEIRASRDEYTAIIGRATIPRDKRPQFRKISWSPDSRMVAVASSDGSVRVYDYGGSLIFKIPLIAPETVTKKLITGLEFIRSRDKKGEWELLIIYANGSLDCYIIASLDKSIFSHHSMLLESGISSSSFSQEHGILFLSTKSLNLLSFESSISSVGLTAWRLLNEAPYYKQIFPTTDELSILKRHGKIWTLFALFSSQDCINKLALSPNNEYLATLHTNGTVRIWLSPILSNTL